MEFVQVSFCGRYKVKILIGSERWLSGLKQQLEEVVMRPQGRIGGSNPSLSANQHIQKNHPRTSCSRSCRFLRSGFSALGISNLTVYAMLLGALPKPSQAAALLLRRRGERHHSYCHLSKPLSPSSCCSKIWGLGAPDRRALKTVIIYDSP